MVYTVKSFTEDRDPEGNLQALIAQNGETLYQRDTKGRFTPGQSGNPKGRPKREPTLREILETARHLAVMKMLDIMNSDNEAIALQAATQVLQNATQILDRMKQDM